jgi:hypothetical protein
LSDISKLRDAADILLDQGKYTEAYGIYDEVYKQIWSVLGTVQSGLNLFTQNYLNQNFRTAMEFRSRYTIPAANSVCLKVFGLDIDETLNEFIFTSYGHLHCICYSPDLINEASFMSVASEFLLLYNLILLGHESDWITGALRILNPVVEDSKFRRIRPMITETNARLKLVEEAEKIKSTDWFALNISLLDYLGRTTERNGYLFNSIAHIVGPHTAKSKKRYKKNSAGAKQQQEEYQRYERYEKYEKYERYEKFEKQQQFNQQSEFDLKTATEFEKAKFFGAMFGLKGQVTKSTIRKKYIELISKYHPDKVAELGPELIDLAEKKTKEINAAYEWFKQKHGI